MSDKSMKVPFVDLGLQHRRIADEVVVAIQGVLDRTEFILGDNVTAFESEFAAYCGTEHAVGVGNGTDALELAFRGAGIGPGDEVIIPANTFVATAEGVERAGATVVLADCDDNFLLDPESVASVVTPRTKAVVPVHLYGQLAPVQQIHEAAGEHVLVVEDAAQSQGAKTGGRASGSLSLVAATSFYPGKNLGAYGDAGGITTDSTEIAERIRAMRNHGGIKKYEHNLPGTNSRLDGIQAVVLSLKLARLDAWNAERVAAAQRYAELLADVDGLLLPTAVEASAHVWHLYVIRVPNRDAVLASLQSDGIGAGIHYPAPIHRLGAFSHLPTELTSLARSEALAAEILSLPIFPGISSAQQEYVAERLVAALRQPVGARG